jgi:bacterioferritin-associated ferredoxin
MYICICNALTERQVDQAVSQGARRADEVYTQHGCSVQCGKCVREVKDKLASNRRSTYEDDALVQLGS